MEVERAARSLLARRVLFIAYAPRTEKEDSRLASALHVRDRLLADLERRGERADEEHRERVEDRSELHLD